MLLWYFLKRVIQVHVHRSLDKTFQGLQVAVTEFANNVSWDSNVQMVIRSGKKKCNQVLSDSNIHTVARRIIIVRF